MRSPEAVVTGRQQKMRRRIAMHGNVPAETAACRAFKGRSGLSPSGFLAQYADQRLNSAWTSMRSLSSGKNFWYRSTLSSMLANVWVTQKAGRSPMSLQLLQNAPENEL